MTISRRKLLASGGAGGLALAGLQVSAQPALKPLRIAYFETYRPLSFRAPDLKGLLVDVLDEVLTDELQVPCSHEGFPWPRAQALVQVGERDAMCTIATPQRLEYAFAAETPVVEAPTCIYVDKDNPLVPQLRQVRSLEQLRALDATVLSYSANGWAAENLKGFKIIWGNDFLSALRMLAAGRGDVMVENSLTMQHTLQSMPGAAHIIRLPNPLDVAKFRLLVSRASAHAGVPPRFSDAMKRFKLTPRYADLFDRYGVGEFVRYSRGP